MKFSTRAEYGLKAVVNLAQNYPRKKNVKELSLEEHISVKYLERLMNELRKKNIVTSFKGKQGGYCLSHDPHQVNAGQVIEVLEGSIAPMKCIESGCTYSKACASSLVWTRLSKEIRRTLYSIKLSDLCSKSS